MMSSLMPSEKYSCSGSPLIFTKGSTAIEGVRDAMRDVWLSMDVARSSRTSPTKRKPFRGRG